MENVPKPLLDDSCSDIKDIPSNESTPIISRQAENYSNSVKQSLLWIRNKLPISEEYLKNLCITKNDINLSLKKVQPSSKREGFATVPDVTWDDVGSLKDVREDLQLAILVITNCVTIYFHNLSNPLVMLFFLVIGSSQTSETL